MDTSPRVRLILLCLAILAALLSVVAYEEAGEAFGLVGGSWLAVAIALMAGAML